MAEAMNDGFIGDMIVCALVALLALYWIYGTINGFTNGAGSREEYYGSSTR